MATAHGHSSNKAHPHEKAHLHAKGQQEAKHPRPQAEVEPLQLVITMAPSNSSVLKIEKMDSSGKHHKLAKEEVATLVGKDDLHEIEAALDEAFEADLERPRSGQRWRSGRRDRRRNGTSESSAVRHHGPRSAAPPAAPAGSAPDT